MSDPKLVNLADHQFGETRPAIKIRIWGYGATLDEPLIEIREELTYSRTVFAADGPTTARTMIYEIDFRGRLQFPTGLAPTVAKRLTSLGYKSVIVDHRQFGPRHAPSASVLAQATGGERRLLRAVAKNPLGRIEVKGAKETLRRIVQLYRLFADARIVVAVATRKRARGLRRMLAGALREGVGLECGGAHRSQCRITVSTFAYLNAFDAREVEVLLLADANEAGGERARCHISDMAFSLKRVYAFVQPNQRLGNAERLRLETMAGEIIYRIAPPVADVLALFCPAPSSVKLDRAEGLERKRRGLWRNRHRNGLICWIAKAFAARNLSALGGLGLPLTDSDMERLVQLTAIRVYVLVETVEHAIQLQKQLPGWRVLSRQTTPGADQQIESQPDSAAVHPQFGIVTLTYATAHCVAADVMIRADGGAGLPDLKGFPPPARAYPADRVLVADFADEFDQQARRDSQQRLGQYASRGWRIQQQSKGSTSADSRASEPVDNGKAGQLPAVPPATPYGKRRPTVTTPTPNSISEVGTVTLSANPRPGLDDHISTLPAAGSSLAHPSKGREALRINRGVNRGETNHPLDDEAANTNERSSTPP